MTAAWWDAHPDVRDVVDAADALVLAACARDIGHTAVEVPRYIGHTAVEVPRYEVRERPAKPAAEALGRMFATVEAWPWPRDVGMADLCVARVIGPDGRKRTCVVAVLRRGRVSRAIVVDTEAP